MAASKVSEKSTKVEIWEAYNTLLVDLKQRPVAVSDDPAKLQQMTAAMVEAKASLTGHFEATIERLSGVQQAYQEADQQLSVRKGQTINDLEKSKAGLQEAITTIRKQWEQEGTDRDLNRKREVEAYEYELNRKRRDSEETYAQKNRERETVYAQKSKERELALDSRVAAIAEREQLVSNLQKQVDNFPTQLEQAVKTAHEETAKEHSRQAAAELKDARQALEHEKSILALKLQTAEASVTNTTKQLTELQRQLDVSNRQLKEMAVTVIQAQNPPVVSNQPL